MLKYVINAYNKKTVIRREIYGHFAEHLGSCIYGGIFVGKGSPIPNEDGIRRNFLDAFRKIKAPVLRWPGGCFADTYHWRDGVGPLEQRKRLANMFWGGAEEDNSFGTHEFLRLCELAGCEPYINGNLGSGTAQEMAEWVEYMTYGGHSAMSGLRRLNGRDEPWRVKYFGVGNENWGCGGNMCPQFYANEFKRYQTYLFNYSGNELYKIACGPSADDYDWMDTVMAGAGKAADAVSMHYYTLGGPDWQHKGSAADFGADEWYETLARCLRMDEIVSMHEKIMDRRDPAGRVGLIVDEWGGWYDAEPGTNPGFLCQQNTLRDAMIAAVTLNIFNKHSRRVVMANLAQTVNVLQALMLTRDADTVLTPTYHVFGLYKGHQGATLVDTYLQSETVGPEAGRVPALHESASLSPDGSLNVTLCNLSLENSYELDTTILGMEPRKAAGNILTGDMRSHNTFERPDAVKPQRFTGCQIKQDGLAIKIPPASIVSLALD